MDLRRVARVACRRQGQGRGEGRPPWGDLGGTALSSAHCWPQAMCVPHAGVCCCPSLLRSCVRLVAPDLDSQGSLSREEFFRVMVISGVFQCTCVA